MDFIRVNETCSKTRRYDTAKQLSTQITATEGTATERTDLRRRRIAEDDRRSNSGEKLTWGVRGKAIAELTFRESMKVGIRSEKT